MLHVDEGALHAYLDGALEEYPTGEARRIRAHLERCESCARALAEARRVRDRADMLLAIPDVDVSLPPLEELRRMAQSAPEGGEASPRRIPLHRLGWAASVVLALGVGWMLRGGVREEERVVPARATADVAAAEAPAQAGQAEPRPAALAAASDEASGADAAGPDPTGARRSRASQVAEAVPAPPTTPELPEMDAAAVGMAYAEQTDSAIEVVEDLAATFDDRVAAREEAAVAPVDLPEAPAEPSTDAGNARVAAADAAADTPRAEERSVVASPRLALEARAAPVASGLRMGAAAAGEAEEGARADEVSEPGSLVVPGLEVVSIMWREEGVVPAGVRVLQRLDDGELLELIHLPAGFDPDAVEVAEPGLGELVVPRDQGWLIMRAPLAAEELRALLERMDAPSPE